MSHGPEFDGLLLTSITADVAMIGVSLWTGHLWPGPAAGILVMVVGVFVTMWWTNRIHKEWSSWTASLGGVGRHGSG